MNFIKHCAMRVSRNPWNFRSIIWSVSSVIQNQFYPCVQQQIALHKSVQNIGVKGIQNKKGKLENRQTVDTFEDDEINIDDSEYDSIANTAMHVVRKTNIDQNVLVIQPYIKWGPNKELTKPHLQLQEAESLIRSISSWRIVHSLTVPLETLARKQLFGKGKLEELKNLIKEINDDKKNTITCIFISKGTLSFAQKQFLENEFHIPVIDRYSVVIQILRLHATSAEAKVQVALAELPYIWHQYKEISTSTALRQGFYINDLQKEILRKREKKLKLELENLRLHRKIQRHKRKQKDFPIIAIVGYTNAGKTSLIKALTQEESIQPKNQLFATLDVTAHAGYLPCNLEVIYMDTVGFISDIPTQLIECFVATLEDAMIADLIIHVQDLSNENHQQQKLHVEKTLQTLIDQIKLNSNDYESLTLSDKIINVGNKIDLIENIPDDIKANTMTVSTTTFKGLDKLLEEIESKILKLTNRRKLTIRIRNGGDEMTWLYKNAAVSNTRADPNDEERLLMDVVISTKNFEIFKHKFAK